METKREAVIFDADDTLWFCGRYYDATKQRLIDYFVGQGLLPKSDRDHWLSAFEKIDLSNLHNGYYSLKDRFPTSMGQCYQHLCLERHHTYRQEEYDAAVKIGYSVYDLVFETMPGAIEMLEALRQTHDLYLYSQGDEDVQIKRVLSAGLDHFFAGIGIPERKTPAALTRFLLANNVAPATAWVVGNSKRSDIKPALAVGVPASQCILLNSYSWGADQADVTDPIQVVSSLAQVAPLIQRTRVAA